MFIAPPATPVLTYYVSSGGNDANDGLSPAKPWATLARVNAADGAMAAGTTVRFKRGDLWHEQLNCLNQVNASDTTTLESNPPACSGLTFAAYGTGPSPIFDGADALHLTWTRVSGDTWKATLPQVPSKIFVDDPASESVMLLPMPNPVGEWSPTKSFNFLDMVTDKGSRFIYFKTISGTGGIYAPALFIGVDNPVAGNHTQSFSSTNTGLQNVQATPGSWYYSGSTIFVHLADDSSPNDHLIEGTYRKYGVLLSSVNHVTVEDIAVERTQKSAFAAVTYSDSTRAGQYSTNEYNTFANLQAWNYGDIGARDCLPNQTYGCLGNSEAGILSHAFLASEHPTELLRGTVIKHNQLGRFDTYMGLLGGVSDAAGIQAQGQSDVAITNNAITTVTAPCLIYHTNDVGLTTRNQGGEIAGNTCGDNQGNIYFGATINGRVHHNVVSHSYGEGIQLGGNDNQVVVDHNLIFNLGLSASASLYNGLDCNGGASYTSITNNTIVNTYAAAITVENGCDHAVVENNVFSQHELVWPKASEMNHSYLLYFVAGMQNGSTFDHNLWFPGSNAVPFNSQFDCTTFFPSWPDANSSCADPQFVDSARGDFRLRGSSAGHGAAVAINGAPAGSDLGAGLSAASFKVRPAVLWKRPGGMAYGSPLGSTQLDATSSVPGTFVYSPPEGTVLGAGEHTLSVLFTPDDPAAYASVSSTISQTIVPANLHLQIDNVSRVYGTRNLDLTGILTGIVGDDAVAFTLSVAGGALLSAGTYPIHSVVSGDKLSAYTLSETGGTLTITKAPTRLSISTNRNARGKLLRLTTAVAFADAAGGPPSGDVLLYDGSVLLRRTTLHNGHAAFELKGHTFRAKPNLRVTYLGDANSDASSSSLDEL